MNWTPEATIAAIENTWGTYKPGMKAIVKAHFANSSSIWMESTFEVMTDYHAGGWPPTKADMLAHHDEIKARSLSKVKRVPVSHHLEENTEEYVSPEVGLERIREILATIGKSPRVIRKDENG